MWNYEKRLQHPVKITQTNPKIAQVIISQFGGPDGELGASMRYLSQRYTMPCLYVAMVYLNDISVDCDFPQIRRHIPCWYQLHFFKDQIALGFRHAKL